MGIVSSDGLSLLIGDGAATETFAVLKGVTLSRLEITQQLTDNPAIGTDAWNVGFVTTDRRAVIECEMLASDETPALRLRGLALSGLAGNFKLALRSSETIGLQAFITQYEEVIQAGEIKRVRCRLESTAAITLG